METAKAQVSRSSQIKLDKQKKRKKTLKKALSQWQFYLMLLIPLTYVIVFNYLPMSGIIMAFKDYSVSKGIWASDWVGMKHFVQFLTSPSSMQIIWNTLALGLYTLIAGFPIPILLAIALNEVSNQRFKKLVQMITYAPYFISTVVMVGLIMQVTDMRTGIINIVLQLFGQDAVNFLGNPNIFPSLYVWSGIWQTAGYSAIIYLAALSGVSKELQEAAIVDGASRLKRIWHIDLPAIRPQIIILLIFNVGSIMNIGFEKVYLMQNSMNMSKSEIIATFVYKVGLVNADYSFSTAVGLFNSVVGFILLISVNWLAKKFTDTSVW